MKIHPVIAELCHAERWLGRQRDVMKLSVAFCNFVNVCLNE